MMKGVQIYIRSLAATRAALIKDDQPSPTMSEPAVVGLAVGAGVGATAMGSIRLRPSGKKPPTEGGA
jgi:hypothetical protein